MFAVVSVRKGHLKVTKESGISLVNKHIMEKKETNKVTKTAKMEAKTTSRGEKCLAKFTAANGNVYGSLTLDIKQEITRNRFLWLCVCAMLDRRSFFVWAKHTLWKNG